MKTANTTAKTTAKTTATVDVDTRTWAFAKDAVAILGQRFDARYSLSKTGDVYAYAKIDGQGIRIHVGTDSPAYHDAFDAAMAAKAAVPAKQEKPAAKPAAKPVAKVPAKQEKAAAKPAANVPAKQEKPVAKPATAPKEQPMSGKGWRIVEDNAEGRIRVYLDADVSDAVKTAVVDGGFWWTPTKQAYSKRCNPRGMRAAAALAETLHAITK